MSTSSSDGDCRSNGSDVVGKSIIALNKRHRQTMEYAMKTIRCFDQQINGFNREVDRVFKDLKKSSSCSKKATSLVDNCCPDCHTSQHNCHTSQHNCHTSQHNCHTSQHNCCPSQNNCCPSQNNCCPSQNNCCPSQNNCCPSQHNCGPSQNNCCPSQHNCGTSQHNCGISQHNCGTSQHNCCPSCPTSQHNCPRENVGILQNCAENVVEECLDLNANPVIRKPNGTRAFLLRYDVGNYKPEEITITITPLHEVMVIIRREDKTDKRIYTEEFSHLYKLPEEANPERMTAFRTKDGILKIELPLEKIKGESYDLAIPIELINDSNKQKSCMQKYKTNCEC